MLPVGLPPNLQSLLERVYWKADLAEAIGSFFTAINIAHENDTILLFFMVLSKALTSIRMVSIQCNSLAKEYYY